jgi:putative ABC transport system permease protein
MFKLTRKGLWSHKRRLLSTFLAVALGVAFLSGTLVLGDTMRGTFSDLFETGNKGMDAVVQADRIESDGMEQAGLLDQALVDKVRAVDGVAQADPVVEGYGKLIGKDGKSIGGNGPPTFAGNWLGDSPMNSYKLVEGRAPEKANEVVINRGAAKTGGLKVGDTTTIQTPLPVPVEIVGLSTFGSVDSAGGITYTAFTLDAAQDLLLHQSDKITSITVTAQPGVSQDDLVARIAPVLPNGIKGVTEHKLTEDQKESINSGFLNFFTTFLLVFAGIALMVATFSIYNTFSIIVAQRARESALLRALGASRRQVLGSTVTEAVVVGVSASVVGLFGGLAIASVLKGAFTAFGIDIPASGLVFNQSTAVVSLLVGIVVTLVAGFLPALRSSRIPPIAALRDVAFEKTTASFVRVLVGGTITALGVGIVLRAVLGGGDGVLALAGLGSLLTIVGVVALGPVVARTASGMLGWPVAKVRGVTGGLARENAMRNPKRTSGTAAALMIGVGVVTLFTVFAASVKASVDDSISSSFGGDLVVSAGGFGGGFSPQLAEEVGRLPEVATTAGIGSGGVRLGTATRSVTVADPAAIGRVLDLDVVRGSLDALGPHDLAVEQKEATERHWDIGSVVPVSFVDGTTEDFTVGALYNQGDVLGSVLMPRAGWTPHATQSMDVAVLTKLHDGVSVAQGRTAIEGVASKYAGTEVQDKDQYVASVGAGINQMLGLIYVMLVLAILIALMGIANTLSLSIHERTRELGLLRAVGQTRRQVRSMVRWESVIMAVFGTVGGVGVGVFLGWALVKAASGEGIGTFSPAPGQLVTVFLVGAFAGVLAALRPASRAAKLDILTAIATD